MAHSACLSLAAVKKHGFGSLCFVNPPVFDQCVKCRNLILKIRIKLFGVLRHGRFKDEVLDCPDGSDIASIVAQFQFPPHQLGIILVNGLHADIETKITDGDTLSLLPIVDGG